MLRILDITAPDINNGNGVRVTLWVSGCTHKCKGCHNSWTWDFNQGKSFIEYQDEILNKLSEWLKRDYVDGITFSGGDPLDQDNDGLRLLLDIIKWVRRNYPTKTIWCYTGYVYEELKDLQKTVADNCDVLVDGPYKEELRDIAHCPFRGSTNQRIIHIKDNENIKK
jgi:anaerobic ribonucleoside-triphosphate reductase activating protein